MQRTTSHTQWHKVNIPIPEGNTRKQAQKMRPKEDQNSARQIPTPATPCQAPGSSDGIICAPLVNLSSSVTCAHVGSPLEWLHCVWSTPQWISHVLDSSISQGLHYNRFHLHRSCNGFSGLCCKESDAVPQRPASDFFNSSLHTFTWLKLSCLQTQHHVGKVSRKHSSRVVEMVLKYESESKAKERLGWSRRTGSL